ncbi:MucR family transcriptional regulator [Kumtagia ephedrae]|uniref:MucR family transcriptional regulator n=1 Tax=Kumtagia ephedrae TaxID=2116701 RepID=A0A2P7SPF3_9HYPH|nr:MucR family transcriptional regulator [Mesorhizobium ephedrae]PSJ64342.1 MucR family transcriptional regulator [Mesorhizobium ephedrae]
MNEEQTSKLELTVSIVSAYVSKNSVPMANLADLVASVHSSLDKLADRPAPESVPLTPAVPIKKSVTPDYIVSLEDGRKFKSLKRHLATQYGMTPEQYRAKWNLPADYPMVAPNYATTRSTLAKSMGLGRKAEAPAPRKTRGRPRKAKG